MENQSYFLVKSYMKGELAHLYNPNTSIRTANRILMEWIERNNELNTALAKLGMRKCDRIFPPRAVQLIVQHLGEP